MSKTHHDMRDAFAECDESFAELVHVLVRSKSVLIVVRPNHRIRFAPREASAAAGG